MRRYRLAERLLSLVGPADRAASAIGDLMEEADGRGRFRFWRSVLWLWLSMFGRSLIAAPLTMAVSGVIGWFLYMILSLVLAFAGYVVVTLGWGAGYVITHHTGLELLLDVFKVRYDWPPIPPGATWLIQAVVLFVIAPFVIGRGNSVYWRGRELSTTLVLLIIWTAMAKLVPIVGVGISARPSMVPVIVMFMLAGALFERFRHTPASS